MRNRKLWIVAIGMQTTIVMVLGSCQLSLGVACGDGWCSDGEVCLGSDSAHPACIRSICGNGRLEPGEECDDGNTRDGDGCSADCRSEGTCGNGILDTGEECDDSNLVNGDGCEADCTLTAGPSLPSSCAQIADAAAHAALGTPLHDSEFRLFFGGDSNKPWKAYCSAIAGGSSKEYLTLNYTGDANFSQYTAGGGATGTNVRTSYTRIRIDPGTLDVDTADQAFATSSGSLNHPSTPPASGLVTAMTYAAAMTCTGAPTGVGNIDVRGTPFQISPSTIVLGPASSVGMANFSANNQVVNLTGGGSCGWISPMMKNRLDNPFNQNGTILPLIYP